MTEPRFFVEKYSATNPGGEGASFRYAVVDRDMQRRQIKSFGRAGARLADAYCAEANADPALRYEPTVCTVFPDGPSPLEDGLVRAVEWIEG